MGVRQGRYGNGKEEKNRNQTRDKLGLAFRQASGELGYVSKGKKPNPEFGDTWMFEQRATGSAITLKIDNAGKLQRKPSREARTLYNRAMAIYKDELDS